MPLIFKLTLKPYLKIFTYSLGCFLILMWLFHAQELMRFTALQSDHMSTIAFSSYLLMIFLPFGLIFSSCVATNAVISKLSNQRHLLALQTAGFQPYKIIEPLLIIWLSLSAATFWIFSESTSVSKNHLNNMRNSWHELNLVNLITNKTYLQLPGIQIIYDDFEQKNVWIAQKKDRLSPIELFLMHNIQPEDTLLKAEDVCVILRPTENAIAIDYSKTIYLDAKARNATVNKDTTSNEPRYWKTAKIFNGIRYKLERDGCLRELSRRFYISLCLISANIFLASCNFSIQTRQVNRMVLEKACFFISCVIGFFTITDDGVPLIISLGVCLATIFWGFFRGYKRFFYV